ncbi:hypothetical protein [Aurantibacter aestuarii]|uniref:Uncharacterized protein n=1 Tax=Aurantibacter aestuarii TaxID=1266046 RepID=A0A2T1N4R3_9FLAO|nr:hypothetical protein [Aurantibacter aestuarii]PSG86073.1 hypothetical protein C7H52_13065 [Aurantibacter aestuarii]
MTLLYFDPGLGAMIIQALVAAVAAVVLFSKNLMFKIKSFFGLIKHEEDDMFGDIDVNKKEDDTSN